MAAPLDAAAPRAGRAFPWLQALALVGVLAVLAVVAAEIGLRLSELPEQVARQRTQERGLYVLDPHAGYVMRPGFNGRLSTGEFNQTFRVNARGLRGPEIGPRAADETRVVVLGDSYTFGGQVAEEERFTERLQTLLAARGRTSVRVVNAGVGGWTTRNQAGFLRANLDWLQPSVVVVAFYVGNDVGENVLATFGGYREDPANPNGIAYGLDGAALLRYSNDWFEHNRQVGATAPGGAPRGEYPRWRPGDPLPTPAPNTTAAEVAAAENVPPERRPAPPPPLDVARTWLRQNVRVYDRGSDLLFLLRRGYRRPEPLNLSTWITYALADPPAWYHLDLALPLSEAYLEEVRQTAASVGAPTLVLLLPNMAQVEPRRQAETLERFRLRRDEVDFDLPQRALAAGLARRGIPTLDLAPAFRARPDVAALFYPRDEHFTAAGHQATAEALAEGLERLGLLDRR